MRSFILPILLGVGIWLLTMNHVLAITVFFVFCIPTIINIYLPYSQDNPKHLWFKRKIYGWGWVPVTWQGWLTTGIYIFLVVAFGLTIDEMSPPREVMFTFGLPVTLLTITFIRICYKKGERPKWQWGDDGKE